MPYMDHLMVKQNHLKKILENVFSITKNSNKVHHIAGDFNLNLLDHENSRKVQDFLNLIY